MQYPVTPWTVDWSTCPNCDEQVPPGFKYCNEHMVSVREKAKPPDVEELLRDLVKALGNPANNCDATMKFDDALRAANKHLGNWPYNLKGYRGDFQYAVYVDPTRNHAWVAVGEKRAVAFDRDDDPTLDQVRKQVVLGEGSCSGSIVD